jgi:hypothetical protein
VRHRSKNEGGSRVCCFAVVGLHVGWRVQAVARCLVAGCWGQQLCLCASERLNVYVHLLHAASAATRASMHGSHHVVLNSGCLKRMTVQSVWAFSRVPHIALVIPSHTHHPSPRSLPAGLKSVCTRSHCLPGGPGCTHRHITRIDKQPDLLLLMFSLHLYLGATMPVPTHAGSASL